MIEPRRVLAIVVAGLLAAAGACSNDDEGAASTTTVDGGGTASRDDGALPPAHPRELVPDYGPALQALGLRLTDRGGLIDRDGGGYTPSAEGRHLALYVEPVADYTVPQYIEGIRAVTAVFADVFERWPGLDSFDVCQEPAEASSGRAREPVPITQIEVTREQASELDLESAGVLDLVRAAEADPPGLALRVNRPVSEDPAYQALVDAAR